MHSVYKLSKWNFPYEIICSNTEHQQYKIHLGIELSHQFFLGFQLP